VGIAWKHVDVPFSFLTRPFLNTQLPKMVRIIHHLHSIVSEIDLPPSIFLCLLTTIEHETLHSIHTTTRVYGHFNTARPVPLLTDGRNVLSRAGVI